MDKNTPIRKAKEEARPILEGIVKNAYASFDIEPSDQSVSMSVEAIMNSITNETTGEDVRRIVTAGIADTSKVYPKWFGDVMRASRGNQVNRHYDDDSGSAYHSSGDDETDMALNFMSMIGVAIVWSPEHLMRCGTSSDAKMHAWLVRCGIIKEQSGDMEQWRQRARESFIEDDSKKMKMFGTMWRVLRGDDDRNVDNRAYMLWRNSVICNIVDWFSKGKGIDDVNALISRATGKQVRIMLDDTPAGFHCEYNNGNGWDTTEN